MRIDYCDICHTALKEADFWTMYCTHDSNNSQETISSSEDYQSYIKKVEKDIKEICPNCKKLMDEIFKLKLQNLNALNQELLGIYNLQTKSPIKEKKRGKENK